MKAHRPLQSDRSIRRGLLEGSGVSGPVREPIQVNITPDARNKQGPKGSEMTLRPSAITVKAR
jgi:hypothetical protein